MPCACLDADDDRADLVTLSGDPDFIVTGESKDVAAYWRPLSHFTDEMDLSPFVLGYAYLGGDIMVLNELWDSVIDNTVIAHEYGHCLGIGHHDGTLMDPTDGGNTDGRGGGPLSPVSRQVFSDLDGATVMDWATDGIDPLSTVARWYALSDSKTTIRTLGYAGSQYARGSGSDAFYTDSWACFGGLDGVPSSNCRHGLFYGQ